MQDGYLEKLCVMDGIQKYIPLEVKHLNKT